MISTAKHTSSWYPWVCVLFIFNARTWFGPIEDVACTSKVTCPMIMIRLCNDYYVHVVCITAGTVELKPNTNVTLDCSIKSITIVWLQFELSCLLLLFNRKYSIGIGKPPKPVDWKLILIYGLGREFIRSACDTKLCRMDFGAYFKQKWENMFGGFRAVTIIIIVNKFFTFRLHPSDFYSRLKHDFFWSKIKIRYKIFYGYLRETSNRFKYILVDISLIYSIQ